METRIEYLLASVFRVCFRWAPEFLSAPQGCSRFLTNFLEFSLRNPCLCPSPNVIVESWYKELHEPGYDFSKALGSLGTEHFTQVVWKGTSHVAMAVSEDGLHLRCTPKVSIAWEDRGPTDILSILSFVERCLKSGSLRFCVANYYPAGNEGSFKESAVSAACCPIISFNHFQST